MKTRKNHTASAGRSPEQTRVLRSVYGEMKVVDATADLLIIPNTEDIKNAVRNNICKCVFANASRRLYGSRAVVFFRSVAYVDLPNEKGEREVNRFIVSDEIAARIVLFDKTGQAAPGGFKLIAPPKYRQLSNLRRLRRAKRADPKTAKRHSEHSKNWRRRRKAVLMGHLKPAEYSINKTIAGPVGYIRNGTGMAHFTTLKKSGS